MNLAMIPQGAEPPSELAGGEAVNASGEQAAGSVNAVPSQSDPYGFALLLAQLLPAAGDAPLPPGGTVCSVERQSLPEGPPEIRRDGSALLRAGDASDAAIPASDAKAAAVLLTQAPFRFNLPPNVTTPVGQTTVPAGAPQVEPLTTNAPGGAQGADGVRPPGTTPFLEVRGASLFEQEQIAARATSGEEAADAPPLAGTPPAVAGGREAAQERNLIIRDDRTPARSEAAVRAMAQPSGDVQDELARRADVPPPSQEGSPSPRGGERSQTSLEGAASHGAVSTQPSGDVEEEPGAHRGAAPPSNASGEAPTPTPTFLDALHPLRAARESGGLGAPRAAGEIGAPSVIDQIIREARVRFGAGATEMTVRLQPPQLGRMQIRLVLAGDELNARLHTETIAAKQIVEANLPALRTALAEQGIRVDQFTVTTGQGFALLSDNADAFGAQQQFRHQPGAMPQRTFAPSTPMSVSEGARGPEEAPLMPRPLRSGRGAVDFLV